MWRLTDHTWTLTDMCGIGVGKVRTTEGYQYICTLKTELLLEHPVF